VQDLRCDARVFVWPDVMEIKPPVSISLQPVSQPKVVTPVQQTVTLTPEMLAALAGTPSPTAESAKEKPKRKAKDEPQAVVETYDFSQLANDLKDLETTIGSDPAGDDLAGFISTGCFVYDALIGRGLYPGGYPIGRFTEMYGPPGSGKTTLATHALISAQRGSGVLLERYEENGIPRIRAKLSQLKPGIAILVDTEYKWPLDRARAMGLNTPQLIRVEKKDEKTGKLVVMSMEDVVLELDKILKRLWTNPYFSRPDVPVVVVIDSLAATPIAAELEGEGLQDGVAMKARTVRAMMRKQVGMVAQMGVTVVVVNQTYARIGMPGQEASGGGGLKFAASVRMKLSKAYPGGELKVGDKALGIYSNVCVEKSSIFPPTIEVKMPIRFTTGIDDDLALLDFFLENKSLPGNPIFQAGAWVKCRVVDAEPLSFYYNDFPKLIAEQPQILVAMRQAMLESLKS